MGRGPQPPFGSCLGAAGSALPGAPKGFGRSCTWMHSSWLLKCPSLELDSDSGCALDEGS